MAAAAVTQSIYAPDLHCSWYSKWCNIRNSMLKIRNRKSFADKPNHGHSVCRRSLENRLVLLSKTNFRHILREYQTICSWFTFFKITHKNDYLRPTLLVWQLHPKVAQQHLSCMNLSGYVEHVTIFSWMFTTACCLVVGLGLGLGLGPGIDLVSSWLVVMLTYLCYFRLSLS